MSCRKEAADPSAPDSPSEPAPAAAAAPEPEPLPPRLRTVEAASPRELELGLIVHGEAELGLFARGAGPLDVEVALEGEAPVRSSVACPENVRTPAIVALPGSGSRPVRVVVRAPAGTTLERARVKDERPRLPPARELAGSLRGRSLVVVACDALHAAHLKSWGAERDTSPNVDALASEGVRFAAMRSQTSWTIPSVSTFLTGLEQERHGVRVIGNVLDATFPTIAEAFRAAGYTTAAFVQNLLVSDKAGFARGFDLWEEYGGESRPLLLPALRKYLAAPRESPAFVYVHLLPPHTPYQPPEQFATRFGTADLDIDGSDRSVSMLAASPVKPGDPKVQKLRALYDNHVAYGDHLVGEVRRAIEPLGRESYALMFLSDHGEAFGQHELLGHLTTVHDEMVHVPLVLWAPGAKLRPGSVVRAPVWTPDLFPSIADLFGLAVSGDLPGHSFVGLLEGAEPDAERVLRFSAHYLEGQQPRQRAILFGRYKLVAPMRRSPSALFDLEADPGETKDVAAEHPVLAAALRGELAAWISEGLVASQTTFTPDAELEAELKALGYAGGGN